MNLEHGRIQPAQFMLAIACFIQASSLLTSFFVGISQKDSWFVILMGYIVMLPVFFVYVRLVKLFPGKTLIDINEAVFGRVGGIAVSMIYILFFFSLCSLNLRDVGSFVGVTIMPETPRIVISITFALVCAWAARFGIEITTRHSAAFVIISMGIIVLTILLTLNSMDFQNFLPVLRMEPMRYAQGTHIIATIPLGELIVFLMFAPFVSKQEKVGRKFFQGSLLGMAGLFFVVLRDTAVLGSTMTIFTQPSYETFRIVSLAEALNRVEVLFSIALITLLFFKICVIYYATALASAQLFRLRSFQPLILIIGAAIVYYSFTVYDSPARHHADGSSVVPFVWSVVEIILPIVTLIVAEAKRAAKKLGAGKRDGGEPAPPETAGREAEGS